uniref:Uncharacterized protein n=1 Tax=Oryza punctata TaxID=4537 RepID=A0A0E0JZA8_ORYPU
MAVTYIDTQWQPYGPLRWEGGDARGVGERRRGMVVRSGESEGVGWTGEDLAFNQGPMRRCFDRCFAQHMSRCFNRLGRRPSWDASNKSLMGKGQSRGEEDDWGSDP